MKIEENVNLKTLNTFGIEAKARYFSVLERAEDLQALVVKDKIAALPKLILGEGSNVLFTKNFSGIVIKNAIRGIKLLEEDNDYVWLQAGAGENWHNLVMYCVAHGYGGIENLALIPGTVGAAPIQNIGAYGVELKDTFVGLQAIRLSDGVLQSFTNEACHFGYRDSIFKSEYKNEYAILSITLKLKKKPQFHLDYGNIRETLELMQVKQPDLKTISAAVIKIRRSKLPDPKELGNAGSFFKNPIISETKFKEIHQSYPTMPSFNVLGTLDKKIPAAWLIEQCGFKGKRFGNIGVYDKQALILVNYGAGTGQEIQALAENIQKAVYTEFGIMLIPEVNFI